MRLRSPPADALANLRRNGVVGWHKPRSWLQLISRHLLRGRNRPRCSSPRAVSQRAAHCLWGWPKARRRLVRIPPALPRRAPLTTERRSWLPTILRTKIGIGYSCQWPFSFVVFIAAHIVYPSLYSLFPAGERAQNSYELIEGVDFRAGGPDHSTTFFHHKLDPVARFQPQT